MPKASTKTRNESCGFILGAWNRANQRIDWRTSLLTKYQSYWIMLNLQRSKVLQRILDVANAKNTFISSSEKVRTAKSQSTNRTSLPRWSNLVSFKTIICSTVGSFYTSAIPAVRFFRLGIPRLLLRPRRATAIFQVWSDLVVVFVMLPTSVAESDLHLFFWSFPW